VVPVAELARLELLPTAEHHDAASSSSARRRLAGGLRLRLCVGMDREHRIKAPSTRWRDRALLTREGPL
jgi:hypothetical protein